MIPRLYKPGAFDSDGNYGKEFIGVLSDVISCEVTRALDEGYTYSLEMRYPIAGAHFTGIKCRCIISAKPDTERTAQLFEVYRITTPINGVITVYANHISYMLASIPVPSLDTSYSPVNSLRALQTWSNALVNHGFTLALDSDSAINNSTAKLELITPRSVRSALVGSEGSFVDTFGGELDFDNFTVTVYDKLGKKSKAKIAYGVNMTQFEHDENMTTVYTGIFPYATYTGTDTDGNLITNVITVSNNVIYASDDPAYKKVKVVDLTSKFTDPNSGLTAEITPEGLLEAANEYIAENQWGISSINIKVSFVPLSQTEEYKGVIGIEDIALGDTVAVEYPAVGITASARCVKTVFDCISEKYVSIEVGKIKKTIISTLAKLQRDVNKIRR